MIRKLVTKALGNVISGLKDFTTHVIEHPGRSHSTVGGSPKHCSAGRRLQESSASLEQMSSMTRQNAFMPMRQTG